MIKSMTGFGSTERQIRGLGKISVELRSTNHKFLEAVFHLPPGFLSLEEKIKALIDAKLKRGRVVCVVSLLSTRVQKAYINTGLVGNYLASLEKLKSQFDIADDISLDALIQLPGVLSLEEPRLSEVRLWPELKVAIGEALKGLVKMRKAEGAALSAFLTRQVKALKADVAFIGLRSKSALEEKLKLIPTVEERSSFLKETDITEEIERLKFHLRNFQAKLARDGAVGKELDFIAQEMQREANTLAAKTFDAAISGRAVQIKSSIEKIREQVQNIE
ncbi:MAG: YicC family protein [Candidatus Omnitrophica bacterium]|nr:YicC family protein [Candidatus Omnitrophota bacterium]